MSNRYERSRPMQRRSYMRLLRGFPPVNGEVDPVEDPAIPPVTKGTTAEYTGTCSALVTNYVAGADLGYQITGQDRVEDILGND